MMFISFGTMTADDLVNERAEAVVLRLHFLDEVIDGRRVGGLWRAASRIGHQFCSERARDLILVGQQKPLEFVNVAEGTTVGQHVGGIHFRPC